MSGPMGAGKTAVAKELLALLPAPLSYIEGDTFWSFINKDGKRGLSANFSMLVRSMTAGTVPFARSGFRVLLRPSFEVCPPRAATRKEGPSDYAMLKNFTGSLKKEISNRFAATILTGVPGSPNRRRAEPGKVSRDLSTTFPQKLETPAAAELHSADFESDRPARRP